MGDDCSLRDYGDGKHLVAYVEINHKNYKSMAERKTIAWENAYQDLKNKGKVIATDFYFYYKSKHDKNVLIRALEKSLGVRIEK